MNLSRHYYRLCVVEVCILRPAGEWFLELLRVARVKLVAKRQSCGAPKTSP